MFSIWKKKIRFTQMSTPYFKFTGGALKLTGARRAVFEIDVPALPKPAVVEVPTVAPEPVAVPEPVVEVPTVAPEPVAVPEPVVEVPTVAPEPVAVVEIPTVSEVEAPAEVPQASPESGAVPENPATE
jgi:hypothetical protein